MKKTRSTKNALLISALALVMCVSMLVGSTMAWFTDSVTSTGNKIQAGTLKLDLELYNTDTKAYESIKTSKAPIFNHDKWEPGYTDVKLLKIENEGTLALKWLARFVSANELAALADVIDVYVYPSETELSMPADRDLTGYTKVGTVRQFVNTIETTTKGTLNGLSSAYLGIALKMQETANNDYQGLTIGEFDIQILAAQATVESDSFDNEYDYAAGTAFVGGKGTAEEPYLINEGSQLLGISDLYDEYTYFKVADGIETLDMTGVGKIKLNGSFDGNGVVMNNLTTALFQYVGKVGVAQDIKISNFTANVLTTDGSALVRNVFNPGTTTFENVALHGYIEGQYNMGSFYNYGTANASGSDGADYTVRFVNTTSDATLVCTTGNAIGGMLGHGYEGSNYKLSIYMDAASGYTGQMYTTGTATCYQVMGMCSHATYMLNGVEVSRYDNQYPSTRLTKIDPVAGADGYYVAPTAGVDHYVVYVNSQLTAYDENGVKIANKAGMTWNLGKETITSGFDGKIFDTITSATIVNDVADELGYDMTNGALTIYSGRSDNYASGWVTLQVNQYDANGRLLATGIKTVYTFPEP